MAESEKVCEHLHLPIQSGSNRILKQMNRGYSRENYLELVNEIRHQIPNIAITTDIIVGFPGETEEDLLILWTWLKSHMIQLYLYILRGLEPCS